MKCLICGTERPLECACPELKPDSRIARFWHFFRANDELFEALMEYANLMLRRERRKRYGFQAAWERVRWHRDFEVEGGEGFKISDWMAPFYSRYIMMAFPEFRGFFKWLRCTTTYKGKPKDPQDIADNLVVAVPSFGPLSWNEFVAKFSLREDKKKPNQRREAYRADQQDENDNDDFEGYDEDYVA